ncbi:MAG: hypothetical protein WDO73_21305 [Ignavibacteriota bacterium]
MHPEPNHDKVLNSLMELMRDADTIGDGIDEAKKAVKLIGKAMELFHPEMKKEQIIVITKCVTDAHTIMLACQHNYQVVFQKFTILKSFCNKELIPMDVGKHIFGIVITLEAPLITWKHDLDTWLIDVNALEHLLKDMLNSL